MTMFARKLSHLVAVAVCGLLGVGGVLAGDDKPKPKPRVAAKKPVEVAKPAAEPQQQILINALCVEVPAGFCERCGLDDGPPATSWGLTRREAKMVAELIRTAKGLEVLSRPQIQLFDNQTGYVQVGQDFPYVVANGEKKGKDGVPVTETKIEYRPVGASLRVTAVVTGEGAGIALHTESQLTQVTPTTVNLGNGVMSPAFNVQTCQSGAALQDGGTVVIRTALTKDKDGKNATEHLWVLTAHFVRSEKDAAGKLRQAASEGATLPAPVFPIPPRVIPRVVPPSGVETKVVIPSQPTLGLPQQLPTGTPLPAAAALPPAKP